MYITTFRRIFRYTHASSKFSPKQRLFYEKNGYILIKNNVSPEVVDTFHKRFVDIANEICQTSATIVKDQSLKQKGLKGEFVIHKIQDFVYDDVLRNYCCNKNVADIVENIIGPDITVAHSMLINKPPDSHPDFSKHPMHQDLYYFPFRPADKIVATWTAMERVDERNGCLYFVPGSHVEGILYPHEYPKGVQNALYHGIQGRDHLPKVHLPMNKGDTVFFHPLILHGSGPNGTKGFRRSISYHYADTNVTFINVEGTSQEHIAREIINILQTRGGSKTYVDFWKTKSRLVRGPPGKFQKLESHP